MPILYAGVAHGRKIVVQEGRSRDYANVIEKLIEQILPGSEVKKSYVHQGVTYNYVSNRDGYVFFCVADKDHPNRVSFAFLNNLQQNFQPSSSSRFGTHVRKQMGVYSDAQAIDKIEAIKRELDDVKEVMLENLDKVAQRGETLLVLEDKTNELETDASMFRGRATKLKQTMWWQSLRMKIMLGVVILVVIFIIIWAFCGIDFGKCSASKPPAPPPKPPAPSPTS